MTMHGTYHGPDLMTADGADRDAVIEMVRIQLLELMGRDRSVTPRTAGEAAAGGNVRAIYKFLSCEQPNMILAQRLIQAYPTIGRNIGEPIVCQHCGRLPMVFE